MQPSASIRPSAMPESSGAAAPTTSQRSDVRRPWVLVDGESRIGRRRNATTARALASNGAAIEISFELADPPAVSLLFAHFPDQRSPAFHGVLDPQIVNAAGAFVLLAATVRPGAHQEYFVYRAGPGRPSLHLVPMPNSWDFSHNNVGVLPLPDGQHYALVIPITEYYDQSPDEYCRFNVFRSDHHQQTPWSTKLARVVGDEQMYLHLGYVDDGVVYAGAGLLGWIDLRQGILLCNVLDEDPVVRLIQWPVPAAIFDRDTFDRDTGDGPAARLNRHATIADGVIRFTELEYHQHCRACRRSCGAASSNSKGGMGEGWTVTTWTKMVASPDDLPWHEVYTVDARDVSAAGSSYPRLRERMSRCRLLPDILDDERRLAWENKPMSAPASPTLSLSNHDDVIYIMARADLGSSVGWVIAINGREKTLVDLAQFNAERMIYLEKTPLPCAFSDYLDDTNSK